MKEDWRIANCFNLTGLPLRHKQWTQYRQGWDHDHCEACFATFAALEGADYLKEGFTTTEEHPRGAMYHWVCNTCFSELRNKLKWYEASKN